VQAAGGAHFRLWAPGAESASVVLEADRRELPLVSTAGGFFEGWLAEAAEGTRYWYRLDADEDLLPDPASRFQPLGPHGPSEVIDPDSFAWKTAGGRPGFGLKGQVLYEMHLGTFTRGGTFASAIDKLPHLRDLGVTLLELMPVADFPGRFGWGYDGVNLFAPSRLYGRPDDFRRFVDAAHETGLGVILDVVYNHFGPDGNYLARIAPAFFHREASTEWGQAIDFDGADSEPVRAFFEANAGYWIAEFRLDGLRIDATQDIHDASRPHILEVIGRKAREAAGGRSVVLIAENETQDTTLVEPPERGGYGLDGLWNDDFHHSARVALTGRSEAYYSDYRGAPQELLSALKWGYLFQGQRYRWQKQRRGKPTRGLPPWIFVNYIENHDQIANAAIGERLRLLSSPSRYRAMTALLLLAPGTPLLFQGQEYGATTPFSFFADPDPSLHSVITEGRKKFLAQFPSFARPDMQARIPDPISKETFERAKLDWSEAARNPEALALHRDLLRLRREDSTLRRQRPRRVDGAVLSASAFVLRWFSPRGREDRLLLMNLGADLLLDPVPEPLLAPPQERRWSVLWSSEDARYGGTGAPPPETEDGWRIPGESAVLMRPRRILDDP
jgi:maltooligosyltrehalose trehalohydrolase